MTVTVEEGNPKFTVKIQDLEALTVEEVQLAIHKTNFPRTMRSFFFNNTRELYQQDPGDKTLERGNDKLYC